MIKATIEIEEYNMKNLGLEVELVGFKIFNGETEGKGFKVEGKAEKEPAPAVEVEEELSEEEIIEE
jgi:hypothetical protein